jgi:hypothetical protein
VRREASVCHIQTNAIIAPLSLPSSITLDSGRLVDELSEALQEIAGDSPDNLVAALDISIDIFSKDISISFDLATWSHSSVQWRCLLKKSHIKNLPCQFLSPN